MKQIIKMVWAFLAMVALAASTASCGMINPIERYKAKLATAKSFEMDITLTDIPLVGSLNVTVMKDGDKTHTSGFMGLDEYSETVDGVAYKYTKSLTGKWTKKVADKVDYTDFIDDNTLAALLTSSNYTKSENEEDTWYYSADAELENIKNVKIVFEGEDGSISFTYNYNGFDVNGTIEFTKLGEVTVDIPSVS